jgi:dTDP-4-amino-4,6-dideoxygalactose transaminase
VRGQLQEERIQTSVHYPPIHRFSAYAAAGAARPLPMTDEVAPQIVTLPLYSHMSPDDVQLVSDALEAAVRAGR